MTDMDAFDRLIAREVVRATASTRPVDDAAIFNAITTTRFPKVRLGGLAFSAARYVMAVGILTLFGGFLLSGVLLAPEVDEDPAAETESPSPTVGFVSAFPTGTFVSEQDGRTLEFREDGTCVRAGTQCTYGIIEGLYAEMTFEDPSGLQGPATYGWRFDGEELTFQQRNEDPGDPRPERKDTYLDHVYRPVGETRPLPPRETDFPTGSFASTDDPSFTLLFTSNGHWTTGDPIAAAGGSYVVHGNLFTTITTSSHVTLHPATFYWDWDGERLDFRPWGTDPGSLRPEFQEVWVTVEAAAQPRTLLLSDPRIEYWVTVEIRGLADGSYAATATIDEEPLGEGVGDTPQAAARAALQELGEPLASDLAEKVPG